MNNIFAIHDNGEVLFFDKIEEKHLKELNKTHFVCDLSFISQFISKNRGKFL